MKRSHSQSYSASNQQSAQKDYINQFQETNSLRKKYLEAQAKNVDKLKQSISQVLDYNDPQAIQSYAHLRAATKITEADAMKSQKFRFKGKYPSLSTSKRNYKSHFKMKTSQFRVVSSQKERQKITTGEAYLPTNQIKNGPDSLNQPKFFEEQEERAQTSRLRLGGQQKKDYDKQKGRYRENISRIQLEIKENTEHEDSVSSANTQAAQKESIEQLRFYIETFQLSCKVDSSYPAEMMYILNKLKDYIFFHWKSSLDLKEDILKITQNKHIKNFFLWVQPYHYPYNEVCRKLLEEIISLNADHQGQAELLKDKIKELNEVGNGMRQKLDLIKQNIVYHKDKGITIQGDTSTLFKYDAYEEEIVQLKQVQNKLENHINSLNEEVCSLREEIQQKDSKIKRQETQIEILKRNVKNLEEQINIKDKDNAERQKFLKEEKSKLKNDLNQFSENIDELFQEIKDEFSQDNLKLKDTPQMEQFRKVFVMHNLSFEDVYRDVHNIYTMTSKDLLKKLVQYFSSLLEWKADVINVIMNNQDLEKNHQQQSSQSSHIPSLPNLISMNNNKAQLPSQGLINPIGSQTYITNQQQQQRDRVGVQYYQNQELMEQKRLEQQQNQVLFQLKQILLKQYTNN